MASNSKRRDKAANKSILTPVMTLEGHETYIITSLEGNHEEIKHISSISYFPDGEQMISGSGDKTIRRWDLREGKEIEEAREVCENDIVGISRDGRWVVTAAAQELKVCEVETEIVRTFYDGLDDILSIDISTDSTLLAMAGVSYGFFTDGSHRTTNSTRIWSLDTGELVAGPFQFADNDDVIPALRFSENSRKLAVSSDGWHLQVWDVQTQKLDVSTRGNSTKSYFIPSAPVFWATRGKSIVAAFSFTDQPPTTIHEFDPSTLNTIGDSFDGHTQIITSLALSFDCALLASACYDTIKLWSFESRQLLASFDVHNPYALILSPDSRQLAYTTFQDSNINICNIPPNILASASKLERQRLAVKLLNSDATRRRKPVILPVVSPIPRPPRPPPTRDTRFPRFLRKLLPSSSLTDAVRPIRTDGLRNPLDFPATAPLPRSHINLHEDSRPPPAPPTVESSWPIRTGQTSPAIVDVPLAQGKERNASADAPAKDDEWIADEDYVSPPPSPNPNSQQLSTSGQITGEHGSSRVCFCF